MPRRDGSTTHDGVWDSVEIFAVLGVLMTLVMGVMLFRADRHVQRKENEEQDPNHRQAVEERLLGKSKVA